MTYVIASKFDSGAVAATPDTAAPVTFVKYINVLTVKVDEVIYIQKKKVEKKHSSRGETFVHGKTQGLKTMHNISL